MVFKRSTRFRFWHRKPIETPDLDYLVSKLARSLNEGRKHDVLRYLDLRDWEQLDKCFENYGPDEVLERLRPLFKGWQEKYLALMQLFEQGGYKTRAVDEFRQADVQKPFLYLYHDVHAWDILAALSIADVNMRFGYISTFFLNWGFSPLDKCMKTPYSIFRHLPEKNVRIGMHAGPLSSWIRFRVFDGDDAAFIKWAEKKENIEREILKLRDGVFGRVFDKYTLSEALEGMEQQLQSNLLEMRKRFPNVNLVNHHGDEVGRVVVRGNRTLPIELSDLLNASSSQFYNKERLEKLSLQESLANIWRKNKTIVRHPEKKNKNQYFSGLAEKIQGKSNVFLINHPDNFRAGVVQYDIDFVKHYTKSHRP